MRYNDLMAQIWYVYILKCDNDSLYTGITNNIERRVKEHLIGKGGKFTRAFKANKLLYLETIVTRSEALKREAQIKSWPRKRKLVLIKGEGV